MAAPSQQQAQVKSWTYTTAGYPGTLEQKWTAAPRGAPGPSEIHVRVAAAALNPVDIQLMNFPAFSIPLPFFSKSKSLGEDFAGTVIAAGAESGFAVDDEVFGLMWSTGAIPGGALTEVTVVDVPKAVVVKKPRVWSWQHAAAVPLVWLTARTTIERAAPWLEAAQPAHKRLAVLGGSSAVGMYVVLMARQRGWSVQATCSSRNTDFVRSMGAEQLVDYTQTPVPDAVRAFKPAAIIDCVGGTDCLALAPRYITIVGDKTTRASMGGALTYFWNPQMLLRWALGRLGLAATAYDCVNLEFKKAWLEETLALPLDKIVIDSTFPFHQVKEAFERLNTGRAKGKVIVNVAP